MGFKCGAPGKFKLSFFHCYQSFVDVFCVIFIVIWKCKQNTKTKATKGNEAEEINKIIIQMQRNKIKGLFTWSEGARSSGVGFFCFHALEDTKQKKLTPLDRGPPLHVNRV